MEIVISIYSRLKLLDNATVDMCVLTRAQTSNIDVGISFLRRTHRYMPQGLDPYELKYSIFLGETPPLCIFQ